MPNKNKAKAPEGLRQGLNTRAEVLFIPDSIRADDNSVEFVLTTEYPAKIFDWSRFDVVSEVLRADGIKLPENKQVPLLNSHNRDSIDNILGSVREIRVEKGKVVGRLYFSKAAKAQEAFEKIKEGHLDSGSVGYSQTESYWINDGEVMRHGGEDYKGPMLLTTAWSLKEYSLVAIGADPYAKAREEIIEVPDTTGREAVDNNLKENAKMDENKTNEQPQIDTEAIKREAVKAEQARAAKITDLCNRHNLPNMAATLIANGDSIERAQEAILAELERAVKPVASAKNPNITMGETDTEKFRNAATDGLILRSGMTIAKPAEGAQIVRGMGFVDIAREALNKAGISTSLMGKQEVLQRALSTSDFPNILANVANKSVAIGYAAGKSTWRAWARAGQLPDFKSSSRVRLSDAPDMVLNLPGEEIEEGVISDNGETIALKTYARKLVITRQALINDDTGIFNTLFRAFGNRAANNIEAAAYGVLTGNAAMADGGNVFNTTAVTTAGGHANMAGSGAVVSETTVNAAQIAMGAQVGENGSVLSIMPKFLLGGFNNKVAIELLCNSTTATTLTGNANFNPFAGYVPVISGHISAKKWYMIADPMEIDTVEVAFLDGKDTPTLSQVENSGDILGRSFLAYIDYAAKALEWRSMYYNAGQ